MLERTGHLFAVFCNTNPKTPKYKTTTRPPPTTTRIKCNNKRKLKLAVLERTGHLFVRDRDLKY
jgi:hypothetical protein